jgi:O-antigen/teichoic acid export membrane protein
LKGEFFVIAVGRVLQILLSLASVRIMTTLLPAAEVGNYYLIFTITSFFAMAFLNPVGVYQNRNTHRWADEQVIYNRLFVFTCYLLAVCLLTLPTVYCLHHFAGFGSSIPLAQLLLFVMIGLFCVTWNSIIVPLLNLLQHRVSFVLFSTVTLALGLSLSVIIVQRDTTSAVAWLSGQATAQLFVAVVALLYCRRVIPGSFTLAEVRSATGGNNYRTVLAFALPLAVTTLLMWLQSQSYRMIVEQRAGIEFLGMIGLGLGIASNISSAVESLLQQIYLPVFYQEINSPDPEIRTMAWNRMAQLTLPIFISLALFVSVLSPFLIDLLAHGKFSGAWLFVSFGAWIELCRMTTGVLASVAHAEMQTRHLIKSYLVGGVIALVGVWVASGQSEARLLIPAALLISGLVATAVMYHDMKKLIRTKVGIRVIVRSAALSMPFLLAIPLAARPHGIVMSIMVLAVLGSYFLYIQYRLAKPYFHWGEK